MPYWGAREVFQPAAGGSVRLAGVGVAVGVGPGPGPCRGLQVRTTAAPAATTAAAQPTRTPVRRLRRGIGSSRVAASFAGGDQVTVGSGRGALRAAATAAALGGRRPGSLASRSRVRRSIGSGTSGRRERGGAGVSLRCRYMIAAGLAPD